MSESAGRPPTAAEAEGNAPVYTVSEISTAVKRVVEAGFERVRVRGEISRPSFPASGHCYFRLKDENAVLDAVCWRGVRRSLALAPEDGLEVIASGRLTTYAGKSTYQIIVEQLELAGEGALLKLLEERRRKLAAEGLFDEARKRALPYLPEVIGVVTSPTGSVIRDILHRLAARFPRHVLVWPVAVQGEGAAEQVAAAIEGFNGLQAGGAPPRPDVLIVARGGGSLEDLWPFNEEVVVRAAAASAIPLVSAVGHETDTTLIDFAADRRAPTPSAAAEIAVPVKGELTALVADLANRLVGAGVRAVDQRRREVEGLARGLPEPQRLLQESWQRLDDRGERLVVAGKAWLRERGSRVAELAARLPDPRQQVARKRGELEAEARALGQAGKGTVRSKRHAFEQLDAGRRLADWRARAVAERRERLADLGRVLEGYNYRNILARGYAVVREAGGEVLTRAARVRPGHELEIEFADGRVGATAAGEAARPRAKPRKGGGTDSSQGRLL